VKSSKATRARPNKTLIAARTGRDLTCLLKLSTEDSATIELRVALLKKIITAVDKQHLTHAQTEIHSP
jgi:hypothetical protein